jgi:predicted ATP-grasp superfamily ATP-dependent carboligase
MRVIVLDSYFRMGLAVANALDPGYELIGGMARRGRTPVPMPPFERVLKSPRLSATFRYPYPGQDPDGFEAAMLDACRRYEADAVFPASTATTVALSRLRERLGGDLPAAFVCEEWEKLRVLADKWRTFLLCRDAGVPVPRTVLPVGEGLRELGELGLPVVWKPRMLEAGRGVRIVHTHAELERLIADPPPVGFTEPGEYPYVVQEYVPGDLHDAVCCAQHGRPVSLCTHNRLVTQFEFGGPGLVITTTRERDLMAYARLLLRVLDWNGPVLFEFIRGPDGPVLIESNPRVWGSTQLTVAAGLNVCQQALEVFALGRHVPEVTDYEADLVWKWLSLGTVARSFGRPRRPVEIARRAGLVFGRPGDRRVTNLARGSRRHLVGMTIDNALARTTRAVSRRLPPAQPPLPLPADGPAVEDAALSEDARAGRRT